MIYLHSAVYGRRPEPRVSDAMADSNLLANNATPSQLFVAGHRRVCHAYALSARGAADVPGRPPTNGLPPGGGPPLWRDCRPSTSISCRTSRARLGGTVTTRPAAHTSGAKPSARTGPTPSGASGRNFSSGGAGRWTATATMRSGAGVALQSAPGAGSPVTTIDGQQISFDVRAIDPSEGGFFRKGTLIDAGRHHRKFEHGPFYLKAGINGPENFLALRALDDITKTQGVGNLHSFPDHRADWNPGDPVLRPGNGDEDAVVDVSDDTAV